eukprot:TRINITY_DN5454_c0_g1_i1.p1 TRINITY_DN5454_c0_g1~~TRINITY_DN5454_c0_g1_i1.p1  ORF type:complete len:197 (+),score=52.91 TRINITY_DN5454_c0_g1_i1:25-591(+)
MGFFDLFSFYSLVVVLILVATALIPLPSSWRKKYLGLLSRTFNEHYFKIFLVVWTGFLVVSLVNSIVKESESRLLMDEAIDGALACQHRTNMFRYQRSIYLSLCVLLGMFMMNRLMSLVADKIRLQDQLTLLERMGKNNSSGLTAIMEENERLNRIIAESGIEVEKAPLDEEATEKEQEIRKRYKKTD